MPTGLTKDAGWQIGVSRVVPLPPEVAWERLLSPEGTTTWLGVPITIPLERGARFEAPDGGHGEVRGVEPGRKLRIVWQAPGGDHERTLQLAVVEAPGGASVRCHEERMLDAEEREHRRRHWRNVVDTLF